MEREVIKIDLDSRGEYVNVYNDDLICDSLHNYLDSYDIDVNRDICLRINFKFKVSNDEREKFKKMLTLDFDRSYGKFKGKLFDNSLRNICWLLLGGVLMFIYLVLNDSGSRIFQEFLLIIVWFFVGEVVENILFSRREIKYKLKQYKCLREASIEFIGD